ncbi:MULTISPECIES: hypothetical protein [Micromonospora]|uniref:Uncharacterized protein n=1 Tax=Micromonospora yangpuensis TaxID=683228 RepID=A0A1C6U863_9ACTN|nr:hypothetical protein [Micromonospora yangpuensis]GGL89528.1 hypothetical protein GCM10012279_03950 [Micromonospora yangpuensis]SCL50236.1 hypothetical protein GA0070617_1421 [Micromonospora yangpuensis]
MDVLNSGPHGSSQFDPVFQIRRLCPPEVTAKFADALRPEQQRELAHDPTVKENIKKTSQKFDEVRLQEEIISAVSASPDRRHYRQEGYQDKKGEFVSSPYVNTGHLILTQSLQGRRLNGEPTTVTRDIHYFTSAGEVPGKERAEQLTAVKALRPHLELKEYSNAVREKRGTSDTSLENSRKELQKAQEKLVTAVRSASRRIVKESRNLVKAANLQSGSGPAVGQGSGAPARRASDQRKSKRSRPRQ